MATTTISTNQTGHHRPRWLLQLMLLVVGFFMVLPFLVMALGSVMTKADILRRTVAWDRLTIENYFETFRAIPFGRYYLNSLIVATTTTTLQILTASLAAFAFGRLRFWGREPLFLLYLGTLMIPFQVTMIPNFILTSARYLNLHDSYLGLILPSAFSAFSVFLLRQYFMGLPLDYDEAARMDGAGSFRIWWQVIMPLAGPVLATLAIFNFQGSWNDFLWPLVITRSQNMRTIPIGLSTFQGQFNTEWHLLMAGSVIALLPVLIIYIIGQNWFVRGITLSGLGGR
ncbi:MAG: carbohydrate ABC transporter permease [Caldilineaceae bacterium]